MNSALNPEIGVIQIIQDLPLSEKHKRILWFNYQGYTLNEIGQHLHLHPQTVHVNLVRARKTLKEYLEV